MKKVIAGSIMFLAGLISTALVLAGSMANDWTINGQHSAWWNISRYGLMPTIYIFIGIAVIGMALVAWGLFDKKNWAANSSLYIPANPYHSRRKGVLHEVAGRLFSWQTYHNDMQRYSLAKPYDPVGNIFYYGIHSGALDLPDDYAASAAGICLYIQK